MKPNPMRSLGDDFSLWEKLRVAKVLTPKANEPRRKSLRFICSRLPFRLSFQPRKILASLVAQLSGESFPTRSRRSTIVIPKVA
jgi:hypothetical protein